MYYICSLDKLEIRDHANPVDITSDFVNNSYYADVTIRFTSTNFKRRGGNWCENATKFLSTTT